MLLWSTLAIAAPFEEVELTSSGRPRATIPLHEGVFLTGTEDASTSRVAVVFFRRVGAPFGFGALGADDCRTIAVAPAADNARAPSDFLEPGLLSDPERWFFRTPRRTRAFVSTVWTRPAKLEPEGSDATFEVFVHDAAFFRPGATYCMAVIRQKIKSEPNEEVRTEIEKLEKTFEHAFENNLRPDPREVAAIQNQLRTLTKLTTEKFTVDMANALVNVPRVRPLFAKDERTFDPSAKYPRDHAFARALLGLLSRRGDGAVNWSQGEYATHDGQAITSIQVLDNGGRIRLEIRDDAGKPEFVNVQVGLRDLQIDPPPPVAGQPSMIPVSLGDILDVLDGRIPGSRHPVNAPPLGCRTWGFECLRRLDLDRTKERYDQLDAVEGILDHGREAGLAKTTYRDIFEWAARAYPQRSANAKFVTQAGTQRLTIRGMALTYGDLLDAREKWDALQTNTTILLNDTITSEILPSTPISGRSLDQTTFLSNHVIPATGLAVIPQPRAPASLAYYGGVQVYFWPNPVNDPMWTRCRRGICPDLLRSFALELGLTTTATTRVPASGDLRGINGSPVIPMIGAAIHPIPYVTASFGTALTSYRPLGVEGEHWKTRARIYFGLSVQANIPGIIRNQMSDTGGAH